MPATSNAIPLRQFGRHKVKISALGFGGHHLGDAPDESTAVRLVRQAVDGGITFFDNFWEYCHQSCEIVGF
jgi:aryl-alcohol dehydrogenase-like predicted oxidoreductase